MDDTNQMKIEGKDKTGLYIVNSYIELFEEGYDLTVDEICNYLSCTNIYFLNNYRNQIKHLIINTTARTLLFFYHEINYVDITKYHDILLKRILYNREDFDRFVLENMKMECKYKKYTLPELGLDNLKFDEEFKIINKVNIRLIKKYGTSEETFIEPIEYIPEKLYSMKDLKEILGVKHNVEAYRIIDYKGVNKYKLNNLVRYDIEDFKKDGIIVNYDVYKRLGDNGTKTMLIKLIKELRD